MQFTTTELEYTLGALALLERQSKNVQANANISRLMRKILFYAWQADPSILKKPTINHYAKFCDFNTEIYESEQSNEQ